MSGRFSLVIILVTVAIRIYRGQSCYTKQKVGHWGTRNLMILACLCSLHPLPLETRSRESGCELYASLCYAPSPRAKFGEFLACQFQKIGENAAKYLAKCLPDFVLHAKTFIRIPPHDVIGTSKLHRA